MLLVQRVKKEQKTPEENAWPRKIIEKEERKTPLYSLALSRCRQALSFSQPLCLVYRVSPPKKIAKNKACLVWVAPWSSFDIPSCLLFFCCFVVG